MMPEKRATPRVLAVGVVGAGSLSDVFDVRCVRSIKSDGEKTFEMTIFFLSLSLSGPSFTK